MNKETLNIIVICTAVFGAITFASVCTLLFIKLCGKWCERLNYYWPLRNSDDNEVERQKGSYMKVSTGLPDEKRRSSIGIFTPFQIPSKSSENFGPFNPLLSQQGDSFESLCSLETEGGEEFAIENHTIMSPVKPQPLEHALEDIEEASELEPEMYSGERRQTIGWGNLGKIRFSLRFVDKARRKLQMLLHRLDKLQIPPKDVVNVFVSLQVLPDRKEIQRSKGHFSTVCPVFEEDFVFTSSLDDYGFETKSIQFIVNYLDKHGKEHAYGEAKMPLLSREIYNQIETDVSLNIKPMPSQNEIGDILLQLSYSFDNDCLTMTIKKLHLLAAISSDNYTELLFKCIIKRHRDFISRKYATHSLALSKEQQSKLTVGCTTNFPLPKQFFMQSTLRIMIVGKHSSLTSSSTNVGKVSIGQKSRDESGSIHWRTMLMSPELTWSVWHPVYAS